MVTVTVFVLVHPFAPIPVRLYMVVEAGEAIGLAQVEHDKVLAGVQV